MSKKTDVKNTGYVGIKQKISNGRYIVTLDSVRTIGRTGMTRSGAGGLRSFAG